MGLGPLLPSLLASKKHNKEHLFQIFKNCVFSKMVNLIIGLSNVYRNYTRALGIGLFAGRELQLVNCTQKAVFEARLATIDSSGYILVSVLENFIVAACTGVTDEEVRLFSQQAITAFVDTVFTAVQRVQGLNVIVMPPMYRSSPLWFGPYLPELISFLTSEVSRTNANQIAVCSPFTVVPSMLESDGVHLSAAAGDRFLAHLDAELGRLLVEVDGSGGTPQAYDRLDQILAVVNRSSSQLESLQGVSNAVTELSRATSSFESFVRHRFKDDDLIFARMKEESDTDLNRSREDRVVITGLSSPTGAPSTHAEKKRHYSELITRLVAVACASSEVQPKVVDVYINLRKDRGTPLVEARFDTVQGAQIFRREGVKLAKALHAEFQPLFFANSVTQSH